MFPGHALRWKSQESRFDGFKPLYLEIIDIVKPQFHKNVTPRIAYRARLCSFQDANLNGQDRKHIAVVPISGLNVAPPEMDIGDFGVVK